MKQSMIEEGTETTILHMHTHKHMHSCTDVCMPPPPHKSTWAKSGRQWGIWKKNPINRNALKIHLKLWKWKFNKSKSNLNWKASYTCWIKYKTDYQGWKKRNTNQNIQTRIKRKGSVGRRHKTSESPLKD